MAELGFFLVPSLEGWKSGQGCWWEVIWLPSDIPEWLWRENFERENTERTCHSPPHSSPLRCLGRVRQHTPYCLTHMCLCVCQPQSCPDAEWELLKDSSWAFFSSVPLASTQFLACYKYSIWFWRLNGWLMDEASNSSCKCLTWDSYGARSEWSSSKLGMPLNGAIAEVVLTVLCAGYCSKGCGPLWTAWEDLQDSSVASAWAGRACRSCPGLPDQGHTAPERVAAESQVLDTPHSASWGPVEAARGQKVLTLHLSEGPHRAKAGPQRLAIRLIPVSCSLG